MATLTKGKTFTNGETVTPQKLHELVDLGSVSGIVNADIAAGADIADSKLATITTANKVSQSAVANLTTDLAGKSNTGHTHTIANVTGLQTALDGKQAAGSYAPSTGIAPSAITGTAVITTDARLSDARTPTSHTHDDRYYTEAEMNTLLAGKQANLGFTPVEQGGGTAQGTNKIHIGWNSPTLRVQVDATDFGGTWPINISGTANPTSHTHDDRYYTETEINTLLAGKQAAGSYAAASHTHDDRYYTESEIDTKLSGLPVSGHTHDATNITGKFTNFKFGFLTEAGFGGFETTTEIGTTVVSDAGRNSVPGVVLARWQRTNNSGVTSTIGTITSAGSGASTTGVAYNTSSDYRLKTNIEPLTAAVARLLQIPVHRFNWLADPTAPKVDGFLAHEAQAIVPESVTGHKDEVDAEGKPIHQGIDQSKLVPLLVAAVQELAARVAALEAR